MRTVVLVGTDHKFQKPIDGPHREGIENFRHTIRNLFAQYELCAIAEEMSLAALNDDDLCESVAQQLCIELGNKPHNFSDPNRKERANLRIPENMVEADRIREREWLRRILELNKWPLLFICGADHFAHFSKLLRDSGFTVVDAYKDWGPIVEVVSPAPLYSMDTYPGYARLGQHLLNKVTRKLERDLLPNEKITVIESHCGKDFWALKVKVHSGSEGWVLDVDKGINISYPTI